jgi:hypothetical protein
MRNFGPLTPNPANHMGEQKARDDRQISERLRKCPVLYHGMTALLEDQAARAHRQLTRELMNSLADEMVRIFGTPKPDRLAVRKKEAMICWFCENWNDMFKILDLRGLKVVPPAAASPADAATKDDDETEKAEFADFLSEGVTWDGQSGLHLFEW